MGFLHTSHPATFSKDLLYPYGGGMQQPGFINVVLPLHSLMVLSDTTFLYVCCSCVFVLFCFSVFPCFALCTLCFVFLVFVSFFVLRMFCFVFLVFVFFLCLLYFCPIKKIYIFSSLKKVHSRFLYNRKMANPVYGHHWRERSISVTKHFQRECHTIVAR